MRTKSLLAAGMLVALSVPALAACSSGSDSTPSATPMPASAVPSAPLAGTAEMRALCDQLVADRLSLDDATATVEASGYQARVGTLEGQPQAVTMDYREDRFTFDVEGGVVVSCTYG